MNATVAEKPVKVSEFVPKNVEQTRDCLLYTSDAADDP